MAARRVVVMGASAGGVAAILELAVALGGDFPLPILFVQHIGAHRSDLARLVNMRSRLPSSAAADGETPQPGRLYIAPPDENMLLEGGVIRIRHTPKEHHARPAIDPLFRSAALDCGHQAIGVVLTGMLDDGTSGLHAIKQCGGIAVVQDPTDAREPSMPRSALRHVKVDHVAPLSGMAALLRRLASEPPPPAPQQAQAHLRKRIELEHTILSGARAMDNLNAIGQPSTFSCPDCGGVLFELADGQPQRYRCHTGHAFSLRSLAHATEEVTDAALWTGIRSLQEKEAMLRRMASVSRASDPERTRQALLEADEINSVCTGLVKLTARVRPKESFDIDG